MADDQQPRELTAEEKYAPKLPKQIQDQVDAVNAAMAGQQPPDDEDDQQGDDDQGQYDDDQNDDQNDGQQPPPQQEFQPAAPGDDWERRARSAQGRLDQALTANQQLAKRVNDLETEVNLMRVRGAEPPTPPVPRVVQKLIKKEEVDDYGEEFFDVVGRKAKEEVAPVIEDFSERLKRLESGQQAVGKVVEQGQKRTVYDTLHDAVPEWRNINRHPAFLNWLAVPDTYSGRPRADLLKEAFSRHDADRVVNFFQGFLTEATGTPPNNGSRQGSSAPPLPGNGQGSERPTLEQFAAPGRARSAPQNLPPDKPVYTHAWIAKFMADKRTGKFRGREAEADATERDIFQAQHEGRIQ